MSLFLLVLAALAPAPVGTASLDVSTGRPMVQMLVNGRGPYAFVLDTGSPSLLVTQSLVDELGLTVLGTAEVNSPVGGKPVTASRVRVDSITLAGVPATNLEAIVIDMGGAALGMGVVGPALFREHGPLTMDFKNNRVTLGDDVPPDGVETWLPFGASAPLLDVPLRIGEARIDGHIDTGSPGVLTVPVRFEDRLPATGPARTVGTARTIDAKFEIRAVPVDTSVHAGDAEIPLRAVQLAEIPVANLGTSGLRGLTLYVDWEHERFALVGVAEPPEVRRVVQAAAPGDGPRFGLRAVPSTDGTIEVAGTEPGSRAETMGLEPGDRIVRINGKPTAELGVPDVRAELARPDLELTIQRNGEALLLKARPNRPASPPRPGDH